MVNAGYLRHLPIALFWIGLEQHGEKVTLLR